MKTKINSMKPVIKKDAEILILGSMPGRASLEKQEYYGFEGNQFWRIVSCILGEKVPQNYKDKKKMLKDNKIGLWDVIKTCNRVGSSDSRITNPEVNDFNGFFEEYKNIKAVFFNGRKAESLFPSKNRPEKIEFHYLPSTSPLCMIPIEMKIRKWKMNFNRVIA